MYVSKYLQANNNHRFFLETCEKSTFDSILFLHEINELSARKDAMSIEHQHLNELMKVDKKCTMRTSNWAFLKKDVIKSPLQCQVRLT